MARRPSERAHRGSERAGELNLIPIMNLVVLLIPALLLTAALVQITVINATAPVPAPRSALHAPVDRADLAIAVTERGFTLAGSASGLPFQAGDAVTVPKRADGTYDYGRLARKLLAIKTDFPDLTRVTISATPTIDYDVIVKVMDASRQFGEKRLFPDVVLEPGPTL